MEREPVITSATITGAVAAVLALVVAFGLSITSEQETAILGVTAVVAPLVVGVLSRPKVTPVAAPRLPGPAGPIRAGG